MTGSRLQLATHGIKPAGALLRFAQSDGLRPGWIRRIGAHVDEEIQVADADGDTARFDDAPVGVGFLGLIHERDVVLAGGVCFRVAHYVLGQPVSVHQRWRSAYGRRS